MIVDEFIKYLRIERNYSKYTLKNYELDINDYINFCSDRNLDIYKVSYNYIKKYLIYMYDKKYKASSISRKISSLRAFYKYLYDKELVNKNIFKYISLPKKEKRLPKYITNEDVDIIFNIPNINTPIGIRNRLILELLYGTGIRVSELCNIKLEDINFSEKSIRILGKGSKERVVLYGTFCEKMLKLYLDEGRNILLNGKSNNYLIVGSNKKDKPITTRSIELIIDNIIKEAALNKNVTPHVLRHTFATHLLNEGCDILIVKELLGHSSLDTTGIYTHVSNERLRKVYLDSHPRAKKG